jgi:hypothetical protein
MTELEVLRLANEGHVRMIADLAAERDAAKARIDAVSRLHFRPEHMDSWGNRYCPECSAGQYYQEWPCGTAKALGVTNA